MRKTVSLLATCCAVLALLASCSNKDPRHQGEKAGKASCDCYQLDTQDEVESCLDEVMQLYTKYVTDTTFTNAMEKELLNCVSAGVVDFDKPLHEVEAIDEELLYDEESEEAEEE